VSNVIKIDPYNFKLYRFKVCAFFFSDTVYIQNIQPFDGFLVILNFVIDLEQLFHIKFLLASLSEIIPRVAYLTELVCTVH